MKSHRIVLLLTALLGLAAGSPIVAAETKWAPAQQEIVAVIDAWAAAFKSGDLDRIMSHTAPAFSCWEFAKPRWKTRAEYRESEAAFYRDNRVTRCEFPTALIEIDGDTAAVQGRHIIHVEAASGTKRTLQGSWSASLIRRNRQWRFLNLAWIDDRPATDDASIKAEVAQSFDKFKVAVENADLPATLAVVADVPGFRYTTSEGAVLDCAAWKQGHSEHFATVTAHRFFPKDQQITVLGPGAALVNWTGAMEIVPKEGAALRVDPFSASFVFKRLGGAWKLVAQHESGPPPQPVGAAQPPANVEAQLRSADTGLVAAANARDIDRWLACFEESARLFPSDGPPIAGKAAIRPAAEELMKNPSFAVVHRVDGVELSPCGTLAWVDYAFELTTSGPDGPPVTETGRDTTLYRRGTDGRWRVVADLWRPHAPVTGRASAEITTVLDDYLAAVNARDAGRFLSLVADNADLTIFENNELRFTHRELADFVAAFFRDYSGIRATWEKRAIHELTPTAAVATGTFKVEAKDAKGAPVAFRNAFTFVLTKPADRWLVQHIHESTLPQ